MIEVEVVGLEDMVATDGPDIESDLLLAVASDLRSDERGAGGDVARVRGALFAHGVPGMALISAYS